MAIKNKAAIKKKQTRAPSATPKVINAAAATLGSLGGRARAKKLTKEERKKQAVKAINTRWNRYREEVSPK